MSAASQARRMVGPSDNRSLDQLEGAWGDPPPDATPLVQACHVLHATPLGHLTPAQLRMALGQRIGLQWLLPLALAELVRDPLVDGGLYEGDLLAAALQFPIGTWTSDQLDQLCRVASAAAVSLVKDHHSKLFAQVEAFRQLNCR